MWTAASSCTAETRVELDPAALPPNAMYKLLISSVVLEMKRPNPDYRG